MNQWASESDFENWWRKILPAYFTRNLSPAEMELLSTPTYWIGNEHFNDGLPPFAEIAADLVRQKKVGRMTNFEGEKELVLPQDNFARIKSSLPGVAAYRIRGTGHFPMLDEAEFIHSKLSAGGLKG